jgi:hypothetical protein
LKAALQKSTTFSRTYILIVAPSSPASGQTALREFPFSQHAARNFHMITATALRTPNYYTPQPAPLDAAFEIETPFFQTRVDGITPQQTVGLAIVILALVGLCADCLRPAPRFKTGYLPIRQG